MSLYAIGDVQGCYDELMRLLDKINYDEAGDQLCFVGDLVNRGPQSLKVLRLIKSLKIKPAVVLGNHDFHLLAVAEGYRVLNSDDTIQDVLKASDRDELLDWLKHQKLLHDDSEHDFVLVHAGIYPQWTLEEAKRYAQEAETCLQSDCYNTILPHLFEGTPSVWNDTLEGLDRYRFIINSFVLMRYCDAQSHLNFKEDGPLDQRKPGLYPWFQTPNRKPINQRIVFGHWAALGGKTNISRIFGIDTGCVWGHELTALRLDDEMRFAVISRHH